MNIRSLSWYCICLCICLCICVFFLQVASGRSTTPRYQLDIPVQKKEHAYNLNPYFFVHYVSVYGLCMFGLDQAFSLNDKKLIIKQLYSNLDVTRPVRLIVKNYQDKKNLIISLKLYRQGSQLSLMMVSNYNFNLKKIAEKESEFKEVYASLYFIVGNKLIKSQHLFSREKEQALKAASNLNNLADFYLFDEKPENDVYIKDFLLKSIKKGRTHASIFHAKLTLSQYYLSLHDFENALLSVEEARPLLEKKITHQEEMDRLYRLAYDEYFLTKMLAH